MKTNRSQRPSSVTNRCPGLSAWGLEDATRAFLNIIDNVNNMTRQEIAAAPRDLADQTRPVR
ncbi:MAG TPA: hypothetical protein VG099_21890 [Gemmataceae bacterium]|jgi:hypothetical protein|nr:hypothetical protein [Gemmataceae bacterium]